MWRRPAPMPSPSAPRCSTALIVRAKARYCRNLATWSPTARPSERSSMPVLGIDIGTQSLKALVLSEEMRVLGAGGVPYAPSFPRPGWAEQDSRLWLAALRPAVAAALAAANLVPTDIRGLAVCGQLDGCVATDATDEPLGPAIILMDRPAQAPRHGLDA